MNLKNLNENVDPEDKALIRDVVDILETLKSIDTDRLDRMLMLMKLARPIFPKELMGGIKSLEYDFTLVKCFVEQAKKYDFSNEALESANHLFGKEEEVNEQSETS